jgi:hypothetical protein
LQAALLVEIEDQNRLTEELTRWESLEGAALRLRIADRSFPAALVTCRPEDRALGAAHWVQFRIDPATRPLLKTFRQPAYFEVEHEGYQHASAPLSDDLRQSLIEDLEMSDRDE